MRIFVVLICSLGLASVAYSAQQEENKQQKKKQPQAVQHAPPSATGRPTGAGAGPKKTSMGAYDGQKGKKGQTSMGAYQGQTGKKGQTSMGAYEGQKAKKGQTSMGAYEGQKGKKGQTSMGANEGQTGKAAKGGKVAGPGKPGEVAAKTAGKTAATGKAATGKPFKPQHFNVSKQPNTAKAPPVKFQQGKHIEGSQNWQGQHYTVFRNYKSEWHDQNWWHSHHNRIVFVFGSPYYWNSGYWFPAWGYNPNAYYAWDGPIYGYNRLPPDQVIANVQAALQQQGYYQGGVDGLLGPLTRGAIADYQRDHGLYTTSTIDEPTLQSLGMA
jgi:Putative peptidoglycan binding domain